MRILVYAPAVARAQSSFLADFLQLAVDEGHDCTVFVAEKKRVKLAPVRQTIGEGKIHLLHSPAKRMPEACRELFTRTDRERLRSVLTSLAPDLIVHVEDVRRRSAAVANDIFASAMASAKISASFVLPPHYVISSGVLGRFCVKDKTGKILASGRQGNFVAFRTLLREILFSGKGDEEGSQQRLFDLFQTEGQASVLKEVQARISRLEAEKRGRHFDDADSLPGVFSAGRAGRSAAPVAAGPLSETRGEIDSFKNYQILHEDTLWIKGWVDCSSGRVAKVLVRINEQDVVRFAPAGVRGDMADRLGHSKVYGIDTRIPVRGYGSRLRIQVCLVDARGQVYPWKNSFLWLNDSVPEAYLMSVLKGRVALGSDEAGDDDSSFALSGTLDTEGHGVCALRAFCMGQECGAERFPSAQVLRGEGFSFSVRVPDAVRLAWSEGRSCSFVPRLHLWVDYEDGRSVCWRSLDWSLPKATKGSFADCSDDLVPALAEGQVVRSSVLEVPLAEDVAAGGEVLAYLNGREVARANPGSTSFEVPVSGGGNSLFLELVQDNRRYSCRQLWFHRELGEADAGFDPCSVTIAPPLYDDNRLRHQVGEARSVLVIRKMAMPTDEIYISRPLQRLVEESGAPVTVQTVDTEYDERSDSERRALLAPGTVVVVCRYIPDEWIQLLTEYREQLGSIVYLMDDDLCSAPDSLWLPGGYRKRMMNVACGEYQTMLNLCDHFMVACEFLARRYASEKTGLVEPAYLHPPETLDHLDDMEQITIAYHGTQVHRDDIAAISPALKYVHDTYPQVKIQIVMGQNAPGQLQGLGRVEIVPGMQWDEYKSFIAQSRAHIALAPILRTPYNLGKSVIKILDIAGLGAVGLYSRSEPYTKYIRNNENGFLVENDALMWQKALSWLIENPAEIKRQALATQALAREIGDLRHLQAYWASLLELSRS